jgi:hypothetical protein
MLGQYMHSIGYGSYTNLGHFGDYNSDVQRLKGLVGGRQESNLQTISDLAASLANRTNNQRLKDDLNSIALEAYDFESYGPAARAWTRWWDWLAPLGSVAPEVIAPAPSGSGSGSGSDSGPSSSTPTPGAESNTMMYVGIAAAVTIAGIAIYYYTTGAI